MKIAYFVHDLNDPAVLRRVRMLHAGGAEVSLLGFSRAAPPLEVDGIAPRLLGKTADARLGQRALAVARAAFAAGQWRAEIAGADIVMARQLETLVLAAFARRAHARTAALVFECLDIHRLMGSANPAGRVLRAVERRMLALCDRLVVSSPHFVDAHFSKVHARLPPVTVIENKVLTFEHVDGEAPALIKAARPLPGPPWRIGWYGVIRCARSLQLLTDLVHAHPGMIEVVIRGRVAANVIPDFKEIVAHTPGVHFGGAYDRHRDLARLYAGVHFAWAIDFYEEGANSAWLLPNRLYESGFYGAIPIALADVATGAWLAGHHAGVCLEGDSGAALGRFFDGLTQTQMADLSHGMTGLAEGCFAYDTADCARIVQTLTERQIRV